MIDGRGAQSGLSDQTPEDLHFEAVVIGAGPAGEAAVSRLHRQGLRTALIEQELIGGECAYWACIPSKTLLRAAEVRSEAARVAGISRPEQNWGELSEYRDSMIRNLDDAKQLDDYRNKGISVFRGHARLAGPGHIEVGEQSVTADRIVIATGSETRLPEIPGLEDAGYWTNREATTVREVPDSVLVIGGGPVGIELGQLMRRLGAKVTLVESADRLLSREDVRVGELIAQALRDDGVEVHIGVQIAGVSARDGHRVVALADGREILADELIVASGRAPRVANLGLETVGIHPFGAGINIDERCRAGENVWAIGDVTGTMPFTHVAAYQARIACADIAGEQVGADYSSVPRVVFSDPEIAAVGLTEEQARANEIDCVSATVELRDAIARPWTYETDPRGELAVIADREQRILVGAWAVAPLAGEWIHYGALAIKTKTPLEVLSDTVAQFPTYTEAYLEAIEKLEL